jgi:hypothetical protein
MGKTRARSKTPLRTPLRTLGVTLDTGALIALEKGDVIDASVVISARAHGGVIISSDPDDLAQLDPRAQVERI